MLFDRQSSVTLQTPNVLVITMCSCGTIRHRPGSTAVRILVEIAGRFVDIPVSEVLLTNVSSPWTLRKLYILSFLHAVVVSLNSDDGT